MGVTGATDEQGNSGRMSLGYMVTGVTEATREFSSYYRNKERSGVHICWSLSIKDDAINNNAGTADGPC
jgi:hypothetical protein